MINQCSSCGGFCKKSGCERENVKPTPQRTWVGLTQDELNMIGDSMRTWNSWAITDVYFAIEAKLKQKNGYAKEKNT